MLALRSQLVIEEGQLCVNQKELLVMVECLM